MTDASEFRKEALEVSLGGPVQYDYGRLHLLFFVTVAAAFTVAFAVTASFTVAVMPVAFTVTASFTVPVMAVTASVAVAALLGREEFAVQAFG